jgi:hypothetical protein
MTKILWAALITGLALLAIVKIVQTIGAPLFIILAIIILAGLIKARNAYVGHVASGLDAGNQPGRAVTIANRTSRWWDAEVAMDGTRHRRLWAKFLPFTELRIGSLDKARKQQRDQHAGRPVRMIDYTQPNRNGGGFGGGAMTASGMTYDWCTCSEQAMPNILGPDGEIIRPNFGEDTCICQCSECAPKGRIRNPETGKVEPVKARHWRARDAEHEAEVALAVGHDYERRFTVRWSRRFDAVRDVVDDWRDNARDKAMAKDLGWEHPETRRRRGEEVITDRDEWLYRHGRFDEPPADEPDTDTAPDAQDWRPGGGEH